MFTDQQIADMAAALTQWQDWTPTVSQGGNVTLSYATGRYCRIGKLCVIYAQMTVSSGGSAGNQIYVDGIPAAVAPLVSGMALGSFNILFNPTTTRVAGAVRYADAVPGFEFTTGGSSGGKVGVDPATALTSGDFINFTAIYEVA